MLAMPDISKQINDVISEVADAVLDDTDRGADRVAREVDDVRKGVTDVLARYADDEGVVPKHKIKAVLRELDAYDDSFRKVIETNLEEQAREASNKVHKAVIGAIVAYIGVKAFSAPSIEDSAGFEDDLMRYLRNNTIEGLTVYERIKRLTGLMRDRMQEVIRYGVLSGKKFTVIIRDIKGVIDRLLHQIKVVIKSEIPNILRKSIVLIGDSTRLVKGIKITDLRGRHPYHRRHQCYIYAEADKYGMGKGIYKPHDTYILTPHPQCTAYFEYVFYEGGVRND